MSDLDDTYEADDSADIDETAEVGSGTRIWHFVHIREGANIGIDCTIGQGVHVGRCVAIGDRCKIQNGAQLFEGVVLEDDVFVGPCAVFTNVRNPRAHVARKAEFKPTLVKHHASIGANATILCGISIGEYALIGAGAVVTHDVHPHSIVVGNPAEHQGWACECGETLRVSSTTNDAVSRITEYQCPRCAARYVPVDGATLKRAEPDAQSST